MTANIKSLAAQPVISAVNTKLSLLYFNLDQLSSRKKSLKNPNRHLNQQLYFICTMVSLRNMHTIEFSRNVIKFPRRMLLPGLSSQVLGSHLEQKYNDVR